MAALSTTTATTVPIHVNSAPSMSAVVNFGMKTRPQTARIGAFVRLSANHARPRYLVRKERTFVITGMATLERVKCAKTIIEKIV
jgi:hypothetical protein